MKIGSVAISVALSLTLPADAQNKLPKRRLLATERKLRNGTKAGKKGKKDKGKGGPGCHTVKGILSSVADLETFTTVGTIRGDLHGTTSFVGDGSSLTAIVSESNPPIESTSSYTGDLTITTNKGTLKTRGVGVFEVVPQGLGTQFDRIIHGTGEFEGASGFIFLNFESNEAGNEFKSAYTGKICFDE